MKIYMDKRLFVILLLSSSAAAYNTQNMVYLAADAGIFQADFNQYYLDQTDIIQQNVTQSVQQHAYTGGAAIGYSHLLNSDYFLGAEFSANYQGHHALFQSGAATLAFSDVIKVQHHLDLTIVPGVVLTPSLSAYLKLGLSYAALQDQLTSPVGFNPDMVVYNSDQNKVGFAAGLGLSQSINNCFSLFAEANYHDYGKVNFSEFQNFSADYTHSAHVYSYGVVVGAAYKINL